MKKTLKRVLCFTLAAMMTFSLAACGGNEANNEEAAKLAVDALVFDPATDVQAYTEASAVAYEGALGEFLAFYEKAKAATDVSERWALMAIAEAKLMESAVMVPLTSEGGNYAISRVTPYSVPYTLWGNDNERLYQTIVTNEIITVADRDALKAKWAELKDNDVAGDYLTFAKQYLTEKGYTMKNTYSYGYSSDPQNWDVLATSKAADTRMIVQTYDGLMEYDVENKLQPALAESYSVSEDGLTYTFKIRQGVKWVDSQGREVGTVTADDFVAGMQHMLDACGGLEYLVQGVIVNADEYIKGEVTDFSQVGVKAVDDYTLTYTLEAPTSYFMTMLGYGVFAPMNRAYYESQGGKFGAEYDTTAEDYKYGTTPETIAYCGPFLVSGIAAANNITFEQNPTYWNKAAMNVVKVTALYNDGTQATKAYEDTITGTIDEAGLNASSVELAKTEGNFEDYAYVSSTDATSFMAFYNLNREVYANTNDPTTVRSTVTVADAERTNKAMNNVHFRRALSMSLDRGAYNAQTEGEELKLTALRNSYTPGNFVQLEKDVTVDINGTATTFPAGTYYGEIMQAQIDADGFAVTVYKTDDASLEIKSDGYDGWYNPEEAVKELETAIAELKEAGVEITAENPIKLDYPCFVGSEAYSNRANVYKQSIETALGGKVIINLNECVDSDAWYYAGYYTNAGYESNYDIYDVSGWGPDYGDPQTYLDTFLPEGAGYMTKSCGLW